MRLAGNVVACAMLESGFGGNRGQKNREEKLARVVSADDREQSFPGDLPDLRAVSEDRSCAAQTGARLGSHVRAIPVASRVRES